MAYPILQRELTIHLHNGHWYLRPVEAEDVLGPVDYGWRRYKSYPDSFTFGEGLLAGSAPAAVPDAFTPKQANALPADK